MKLQSVFRNLQQEIKTFTYWCIVLAVLRVLFVCMYSGELENGFDAEFGKAFRMGFRISLKTAGTISLLSFVLTCLVSIFKTEEPKKFTVNATDEGELYSPSERKAKDSIYLPLTDKVRLGYHGCLLFLFSAMFYARWTYYRVFNSGFNHIIVEGWQGDRLAIWHTIVSKYHFWDKMGGALIMASVFFYGLYILIAKFGVVNLNEYTRKGKLIVGVILLAILPVFSVYVRFGAAFSEDDAINWKNAARLHTNLLNESILDDAQALYRVWKTR